MLGILTQISEIRERSRLYGRVMAEIHGNDDPRCGCFFVIYNKSTMAEEVLTYYSKLWASRPDLATERLDEERVDRVVEHTKSLFIQSLSSMEHFAKVLALEEGSALRERALENVEGRRHIYLRDVVHIAHDMGVVTDASMRAWDDVITIRNLTVHNNSIADRSMVCEIGGMRLGMRPGRMMKGPMGTYVRLTGEALGMFYDLVNRMDP